jgi:hypothetical protein
VRHWRHGDHNSNAIEYDTWGPIDRDSGKEERGKWMNGGVSASGPQGARRERKAEEGALLHEGPASQWLACVCEAWSPGPTCRRLFPVMGHAEVNRSWAQKGLVGP